MHADRLGRQAHFVKCWIPCFPPNGSTPWVLGPLGADEIIWADWGGIRALVRNVVAHWAGHIADLLSYEHLRRPNKLITQHVCPERKLRLLRLL